jgi:uncharacterized protein (TIGR01777 family)
MRVIITGATGLIGKTLTTSLLDDGHEVIALSRSAGKAKYLLDPRTMVVEWDAVSARGWGHYAQGAGAIVNLSGENVMGMWTQKKKAAILNSRINATRAVVEAVALVENKPKVIVQGSAIGYYGPRQEEPLDESSAGGEGFLADVCRQWETAAEPVRALGSRLVIIRSGIVLTKKGGALAPLVQSFNFFGGGYIGRGEQWYSWIGIDDEVAIICYLIEHDKLSGPYNLVAPNPVRLKLFVQTLGKVLGRPVWLSIPTALVRIAFDQMADELLLKGQRVIPRRLLEAGYRFKYSELEPALRHIFDKD